MTDNNSPAVAAPNPSNAQLLLQLAERCEREEPSRHLDFLIRYRALGVPMTDTEACPLFTTSLDAAVTLCPPDHYLDLHDWTWDEEPSWCASLCSKSANVTMRWSHKAKTGPLAICATALRARAAIAGEDGAR